MRFSTVVMTMYVDCEGGPEDDERVLQIAIEQSLTGAKLGLNPFFTEHHFRGPWHSSPLQFASFLAPQIPEDCWLGFAVLSTPYYHPVRLAEGINLLDHLTKGRAIFGLGSGFPGIEPMGMGIDNEHHRSSRAGDQALDVLQKLWAFQNDDPAYEFKTEAYGATVVKRVVPSPYRKERPRIIATANRPEALARAARNGWPIFLGTFGDHAFLIEQLRSYREQLAVAGHGPETLRECAEWSTYDMLDVAVADSDEEALAAGQRGNDERLAMRKAFADRNRRLPLGPAIGDDPGRTAAQRSGREYAPRMVAGNPDTVSAEIQKLRDLGINHVLVRFLGEWAGATRPIAERSLKLFGEEVLPRFAGEELEIASGGQRLR